MAHNPPNQDTLIRLFLAYMEHVCDEEGTDFLYDSYNVDHIASRAKLTTEERLWLENLVITQHEIWRLQNE